MLSIAVFFRTYGCQANVADSEGLALYLNGLGCTLADSEEDADLIIVNSCAVRAKAEQKMFSYLGSLAQYKKKKPYMRIGMIGCVASYRKKEVYDRYDHVSFVYGARENMGTFQTYLADLIVRISTAKQFFAEDKKIPASLKGQDRLISAWKDRKVTLFPKRSSAAVLDVVQKPQTHLAQKAYINITTGCDNYCTYCIVPFTRGREESYPLKELVERAQTEVTRGAREIHLVGQNVNSYKDPVTGEGFAQLLEGIAQIEGQFWIRYVSPHPKDMTNDVLDMMAAHSPKICAWVHLPLQAGSTRVLDVMGRTYTKERFLEQVQEIRKRMPHVTITTDIIVGFPSETDAEYLETREVMEIVKFDHIFSFIYSPRKFTKAFSMEDSVSAEEKSARLTNLQKRQQMISLECNSKWVDKELLVLVEKPIVGGYLARTEGNIRLNISSDESDLTGTFVYPRVTSANVAHLSGVVLKKIEKNIDKSCQPFLKQV
ncbi:tRNA (N6-isopentenyl adenosine(37)-C2)-methylthiotransferase MiaB [Candidatus Babeliales bacterium]|nr:tRNA (N6-isopentenyl adenosine(37)-C2)-methylthiotransferase MiaB [Candidatus Babeliales bacterium]